VEKKLDSDKTTGPVVLAGAGHGSDGDRSGSIVFIYISKSSPLNGTQIAL
jgi:hypothetical protein